MKLFCPLALAAIIPVAILAGCATANLKMDAEKADTEASNAYVAIATTLNAYEAAHPDGTAQAEALKLKAWQALAAERQAYAAGQTVDLTPLTAILSDAKAMH